jgi:hypothetical protein
LANLKSAKLNLNQIDIAGLMALAVAVKMNKTIRCLDLNIPVRKVALEF